MKKKKEKKKKKKKKQKKKSGGRLILSRGWGKAGKILTPERIEKIY